jgi:exodeoxyribonuclease VII large subunit
VANFFEFRESLIGKTEKPPASAESSKSKPADVFTVSQITAEIDRVIRGALPPIVMVRGECSNCKPHQASGNFYFTLKDAKSCIDCVMFRDDFSTLRFDPSDGIELLATGRVQVYVQRGKYQLYVRKLEPLGQGALELAFQKLRAKLEAEGLFDQERKKELPRYPLNIALVTSSATAALQDMLKILKRFPWLNRKLHHVPVQGDGAAEKIAAQIAQINQRAKTDVILLSRGGGSLEDLWEFNEEVLARAIASSAIPIVTGVGHEIDTSIADLVADYHAHTPTEAAQVVTAYWRDAADEVDSLSTRLRTAVRHRIQGAHHRLGAIIRHETFRRPMERIHRLQQVIDDQERGLRLAMSDKLKSIDRDRLGALQTRLAIRHPRNLIRLFDQKLQTTAERLRCGMALSHQRETSRLDATERQLNAISPLAVLNRGYSMTTIKKTSAVVRTPAQIKGGEKLITRVAQGEFESIAEDPQQPKLFE